MNNALITITNKQARRFLLTHQRLWPPRALPGKEGAIDFIEHAGCIQYDPVNVVGFNPDLVMQARVRDYRPAMLAQLLYQDRLLLDGWDKMASIYLARDWPYFTRHRNSLSMRYQETDNPAMGAAAFVREELARRGALSSIDFDHQVSIAWSWGQPARQVRATLDILYATGELGIHHRLNTRRYFDFMSHLLPAELLDAPDPHATLQDYHDWHVLRRIGSLGLASSRASEYWLGIFNAKSHQRRAAFDSLLESAAIVRVVLETGDTRELFMRAKDILALENAPQDNLPDPKAAFLAPLDNLLWDRELLRRVFDFDYIWEVYKPAEQRKYGHYVLPVLYGDRFVARFDPAFDRKSSRLTLRDWWWEPGIEPDPAMLAAIAEAASDFAGYLGAQEIQLEQAVREKGLAWET